MTNHILNAMIELNAVAEGRQVEALGVPQSLNDLREQAQHLAADLYALANGAKLLGLTSLSDKLSLNARTAALIARDLPNDDMMID